MFECAGKCAQKCAFMCECFTVSVCVSVCVAWMYEDKRHERQLNTMFVCF